MKSLLFGVVLISLCSCGGSSSKEDNQKQVSKSQLEEEQYSLPKLNSYRVVTIDKDVSTLYENMTVRANNEGRILGDKAFYVMIHEQAFPSYSEVRLGFYSHTKINNIFYFNSKNTAINNSEITKENLATVKLKDATSNFKDELVWGKRDLDNPENDMQNKVYVIRTEEMEKSNGAEVKSESMYLIWFECKGDVKSVTEQAYSCGKYNLKLHYKLLDYSLTSNKI